MCYKLVVMFCPQCAPLFCLSAKDFVGITDLVWHVMFQSSFNPNWPFLFVPFLKQFRWLSTRSWQGRKRKYILVFATSTSTEVTDAGLITLEKEAATFEMGMTLNTAGVPFFTPLCRRHARTKCKLCQRCKEIRGFRRRL